MDVNLLPLVAPVVSVVGAVVVATIPYFVKRGLELAETKLHVSISPSQANNIIAASTHAAQIVSAALRKGEMKLADVHTDNPKVVEAAQLAMKLAGVAVDHLGLNEKDVANFVVAHIEGLCPGSPVDHFDAVPAPQAVKRVN